jgi:O-6-methylguanine DNA methyltransferase
MTFTERVYEETSKIPLGRVTTYKHLAEMCGNGRACRAVGNILHNNPYAPVVPCHRVVSSAGKLALHFGYNGIAGQMERLSAENVEIISNKVDLTVYGWFGGL